MTYPWLQGEFKDRVSGSMCLCDHVFYVMGTAAPPRFLSGTFFTLATDSRIATVLRKIEHPYAGSHSPAISFHTYLEIPVG